MNRPFNYRAAPPGPTYIAGHRGMVGAAILSRLLTGGVEHIVTRTHAELDLTD
jgi:GDP-L-fucose synthase